MSEKDNLPTADGRASEDKEVENFSERQDNAENDMELETQAQNNPENITENLKNEPANLINAPEDVTADTAEEMDVDKDTAEKKDAGDDKNSILNDTKAAKPSTSITKAATEEANNPVAITETEGESANIVAHTSQEDEIEMNVVNDSEDIKHDTKTGTSQSPKIDFSRAAPIANFTDDVKEESKEGLKVTPHSSEVSSNTDAHVKDIEDSNAEDAEDSSNDQRHNVETKDYSKMSMAQLNDEFEKLLKSQKIQTIKNQVNEIRNEFKSQFDSLLEQKKDEFVSDGGDEIDFYYTSSDKKRFNEIYKSYKQQLSSYYKDLEKNLKGNLATRLEIIEEIKGLINVEENINTTYKQFKDLQEQWRNAGPIPRDRYNNTWNTYHHHVEIFYDFLHLNRDLRDMDFKHNLEQKLKIIDRAEELAQDDNINRSFRELQVLHKMWKEDLGPVGKEHREEIWERFSAATKKIHDKRQDYYKDLDKAYQINLERKEKIIAKIEDLAKEEVKSHQTWQNKIKAIETLRHDFFNAGKVPKKANEPTWAKFKSAVRVFNKKKNHYYKNLKQDQYENLQKKLELIKIAENNKESEDYKTVTPLMKKIQSDWKKIGHVPRKDSDKIWKKFKSACNHYFERLNSKRKEADKELYDNFDKKSSLLDNLKTLELSGKPEEDNKTIQEQINSWKELGNVPHEKRYIEGKFNKAVDQLFDKLKMDKSDIEMIKYENKLDNLSQPEGTGLLDNEQNFIRKKIDDLKGEINQLENNMQFFSNASEDNPLLKDVQNNLDQQKSDLQLWEDKLAKLRKMY